MPIEQVLCIKYFDQVQGPSTLYCEPLMDNIVGAPDLDKVLEFNDEEGTFIFAYRKYQTVNSIFYIDSKLARGGKELIMVTYMIKTAIFKDEIVDVFKYLDSKTPILEDFAEEIKKLDELPTLLHSDKTTVSRGILLDLAGEKLKTAFLDIFQESFQRLTPKFGLETPIKSKKRTKKIFIIGSNRAGKKTFLKNLELIQFLRIKSNDLTNLIYEVVIENLEILKFDKFSSDFECKHFDSFEDCMDHAQGLIFIFKVSNLKSIGETKKLFKIIVDKLREMKIDPVPILIIGNKSANLDNDKIDLINKTFETEKLKEKGIRIKYFPIQILEEDYKVMKALRWMIRNIL
ncbi:hypothetical protein LCGC14_0491870 [marine sediment metagenome]|uniref:Uncharacterized protein n=1 Tax=marine sediment metagenome TaxID=412755 RepID=A0A0F9SPR0_9ZZZZ|nr:MAG: small GTP-binding domain protein, Arf-domain signature [Candidatus Lokiarchaeum sp. GC14_75]